MAQPHLFDSDGQAKLECVDRIVNDCLARRAAGQTISDESVMASHPELMPELEQWLHCLRVIGKVVPPARQLVSSEEEEQFDCPHCDTPLEVTDDTLLSESVCASCGASPYANSAPTSAANLDAKSPHGRKSQLPKFVGRYRVERVLGKGAFGRVFLAHDEQLGRRVAVKVPHERLVANTDRAAAYLAEARAVANLEHPHIVPIHDVGSTEEFPCYLVYKYVEGCDLASKLKRDRLTYVEAAELSATLAEALHYAHQQGLVHRDVKPGNILLGNDGTPHIVDFGLALRDETIGSGPRYVGTPAYMSPEQARGEGHRVDGRSDIFSLGVVLYEMLTGRRPFRASSQEELLESITNHEPKPLRQSDDRISRGLERICLKALAKRVRHRYDTASDFAEDLRQFLAEHCAAENHTASQVVSSPAPQAGTVNSGSTGDSALPGSSAATGSGSSDDSHPLKIVPKGLRSFDAHDADFFLELLPGPRDRHGLPDSIRFWKTRIEATDPESAFRVGLIYGSSGCGKSSLVKAGLLPRLNKDIIVVYVEATPSDTERRVRHGLHRYCRDLQQNTDLPELLAALAQGRGIAVDRKVLIVLDQFEQWLYANKRDAETELVKALRQCDGVHLQCIVLVRDDFWLATTRFMRALEIDLLQGRNSAVVDLFDASHVRRVLAAFGRSYGKLPAAPKEASKQQQEFVKQSVRGLTREGKVASVRLAAFAEMMKGRSWTPETLHQVGGTQGIGATFLEETFNAATAHPTHRLHQQAARRVLGALLPESSSDIRGPLKSYSELLHASGYAQRPQDFDALLKILDGELRLITPTEREDDEPWRVERGGWSVEGEDARSAGGQLNDDSKLPGVGSLAGRDGSGRKIHPPRATHFQLTHDYLVPSVRAWLARKQRETSRGRAEICLAEREEFWKAKPENRNLPSTIECLRIATLTSKKNWSQSERKMMGKAGRLHGLRWGSLLLLCFALAGITHVAISADRQRRLSERAETLVDVVEKSRGAAVPRAIEYLAALPPNAVITHLNAHYRTQPNMSLAYALAGRSDADVVGFLVSKISTAPPIEVDNLRTALGQHRRAAREHLQAAVEKAAKAADQAKALPDMREANRQWRIMARLAIVALHVGCVDIAADVCKDQADASPRTMFINEFKSWHGDLQFLAELVETIDDRALRYSICLAVGHIEDWPKQQTAKTVWTQLFVEWYRDQPDSGTHSGAGWALRNWGEQLPEIEANPKPIPGHNWYVNRQDLTMLKILPGTFQRWALPMDLQVETWPSGRSVEYELKGDDKDGYFRLYWPKQRQPVRLSRAFWLADRELTVGQFMEFMNDHEYPHEKKPPPFTEVELKRLREFSPTDDHPMGGLSWFDAALFCNWLSHKEGREACYVPTGEVRRDEVWVKGREYEVLQWNRDADGYRLPTEAEWEYACLAGTETLFFFGDQPDKLDDYCVHSSIHSNRNARNTVSSSTSKTEPCGMKAPNGWGLFNMLGNATEYCQDWYSYDVRTQEPVIDPVVNEVHSEFHRAHRSSMAGIGVTFLHAWTRLAAGWPDTQRGAWGESSFQERGFRVARSDSR